MMHPGWPLAIALAGGLLMGLTVAPANIWILAWVALVPLWMLVGLQTSRWKDYSHPIKDAQFPGSPRSPTIAPFWLGLLWGIGYHGLALSWIRDLHPLMWLGIPWAGSVAIVLFSWAFITLWGGLLVAVWAWGVGCCDRLYATWQFRSSLRKGIQSSLTSLPVGLRVLIGVAWWCSLEWLWTQGPLWWTALSLTQSPHNLLILQLGQLSGPNTVAAAIVAVNGLLAEAGLRSLTYTARSSLRPLIGTALILVVSLHLLGFYLYTQPLANSPTTALKVGLIQGNIPTRIKLSGEGVRRAITTYTQGYRMLADQGVDAILTPEGALPYNWIGLDRTRDPLYQAVLEKKVLLWLGTPGWRGDRITQTLFTISGQGDILSRYDKIKLVPLGEYIPFASVLGQFISRLSPVDASMVAGNLRQQVVTPFGPVIVAICFDSAFSRVFRNQAITGGQLMITASNNDPYGAAMMAQHHAQDVMRAIETNRWAVRATNTGLSGIVDPHGNTLWLSGFRTTETHTASVYLRQPKTLYVRWGDWLTGVLAIASLLWFLWDREGIRQKP